MVITQLFDATTSTFTYLIFDETTRKSIIIDPVLEQHERDVEEITKGGLELEYILETHVHADHITGASLLRKKYDSLILAGSNSRLKCADVLAEDGSSYSFGKSNFVVRHTPGHTRGCVSYVISDEKQNYVFTGDTLFIRGCGRTDFQGGSASTLYQSVHEKLYSLPDDTIVYPGHDYNGRYSTTIGDEKKLNPRLKAAISHDEFVNIMGQLKLSYPKKIDVSLPANRCCGEVPQKENYLDIDVQNLQKERFVIVDVREESEFVGDLGHISGAKNIPLATVTETMKQHERSAHYLLVCRSGRRSRKACDLLAGMGFSHLYNLNGGMIAWNEQTSKGEA